MLEDNINIVRAKINKALAQRKTKKLTGDKVTIVAVTKNHPVQVVTEALEAGLQNIGENRVQEAKGKRELLPNGGIWHLIGHLQTNKTKQAVELFDIIESVDSEKVLTAINKEAGKIGKVQDILLQVNVAREEQKSGFLQEEFVALLPKLHVFDKVRVRGLMVIAQATDNPEETKPVFADGYENFLLLQNQVGAGYCDILSMGMTHDYWVAVEEGANSIRLGTALFGLRDYSIK
ncbi:MAG: YggS family pyridoxal phosphate-dependent enzyme [Acidaminococcaceae bacterium]|nr:YggS family pyridoxal phosphate-dependent enzyme [Acidaminococcaceae bacterium]MDD4721467.1 YggS family pyridoxal phosphate-dependent enzyme [Acidaminococcaceae bacterium]